MSTGADESQAEKELTTGSVSAPTVSEISDNELEQAPDSPEIGLGYIEDGREVFDARTVRTFIAF